MTTPAFLDWVDAAIVGSYFAGTLLLGLWIARRDRGADFGEYALGSRRIPWWAVLGSIIAAEISAATFLGAPAEGFRSRNFLYCQLAFGMILARILVARIFIGLYYRHEVKSIYEFLAARFGPKSRGAASLIFVVGRLLGIGVRLYLGGVIFVVVWRHLFHHEPGLLHYALGIVAILAATTLYTAAGGIKAVIYTDVFQAVLMFAGAVGALIALFAGIPGGMSAVTGHAPGGAKLFELGSMTSLSAFFSEPYTVFAALVGVTCLTMATHGTDQDLVQRMLTARSQRESRFSLILSGLVDLPISLVFSAIGILLFVHYQLLPDPLLPAQPNEVFAHYIVTRLPAGLRGLVIAGIFATLMGSTSAALNSLSVSLTRDWYQPYFGRGASDPQLTRFARAATLGSALIIGLVAVLTAELMRRDPALTIIPLALGLMGITYGSMLGIFLLGALTRGRGDDRMNVVAMGCGIAAVLVCGKLKLPGIDFGALMPAGWPAIAWPWYALIGSSVTFLLAALFRTERR